MRCCAQIIYICDNKGGGDRVVRYARDIKQI